MQPIVSSTRASRPFRRPLPPLPRPRRVSIPTRLEIWEKLEQLDDLVYEAISGRSNTMEQLQEEWPKIAAQLGETLLSESLEQYLRYAMSIWDECTATDWRPRPRSATQALDVSAFSSATRRESAPCGPSGSPNH